MTESLNVIALISGGKDSFFSLLHCIQNGHNVVALGNLYPAPLKRTTGGENDASQKLAIEEDEKDLNSFMYQTVGHTVIPLYEKALGIPLYRQEIVGTAIQTGTSYSQSAASPKGSRSPSLHVNENKDETESLVPLLRRIMAKHPDANAVSTGAILSTYQRTRIESVALRLGLTPLSYLWKYPILPPGTQISLLQDMQDVGLDARIVKVASGGLDESFLWENVGGFSTMRRVEKSMRRFGTYGDGAVLGEGGEFETLVVDGPSSLFKGRIVVREEDRRIVREGGGSAWLRILNFNFVMKDPDSNTRRECRIPDLLESRFTDVLSSLDTDDSVASQLAGSSQVTPSVSSLEQKFQRVSNQGINPNNVLHWSFPAEKISSSQTISEEASKVVEAIQQRLSHESLKPSNIISTVIILRSMNDFAAINKVYGAVFTLPNPPARVTISCGSSLPPNINLLIHLKLHKPLPTSPPRKALHVQSRSYWAPANIGPYSQAISTPLSTSSSSDPKVWTVSIAGQIPLIPHAMSLPSRKENNNSSSAAHTTLSNFKFQTVLSLQHLWRIGEEMNTNWFTSTIAYIPTSSPLSSSKRASIISKAWTEIHKRPTSDSDSEDEQSRDLWEEKHFAGMENRGAKRVEKKLPDWEVVEAGDVRAPPCVVVEVEELPRGSAVEWHVGLGIVGGGIELFEKRSDEGWAMSQCVFGGNMQSVIIIDHTEDVLDFGRRLDGALRALGVASRGDELEFATYLDVSIEGIWESKGCAGVVPCKSIWSGSGTRLAGVLLFGTC